MSQAPQPPKRSLIQRSLLLNLLLVALITCLSYILFFSSLAGITHHSSDIKVPAVTGKDGVAAIKELEGMGFEVHVDSTYDPTKKALLVLQQMPDIGDVVKKGRTLFLTLNKKAPPQTPMPNLINLSFRSAQMILVSNRLILGDTTFRPDIAQGAILEQLLNGQPVRPGQMIPQGSRISLVIGNGLGETELNVPDVIGMTYPEAAALLSANGLQFTPIPDEGAITDTATAKVYKQTPSAINDLGAPSRIRQGDFMEIYYGQNPSDSLMESNRNAWKDVLQRDPDRNTPDTSNP